MEYCVNNIDANRCKVGVAPILDHNMDPFFALIVGTTLHIFLYNCTVSCISHVCLIMCDIQDTTVTVNQFFSMQT